MSAMAAVLVASLLAQSGDGAPVTLAINAPSLHFVDAEAKAAFLASVESSVSDAIKRPVVATFVSDSKLLDRDALWLVDATEAAQRADAAIVLQARRDGRAELRVNLYTHKQWDTAYQLLTKGKVLLP